ncbi:hypothetical protein Tco_1448410 [Tanacetum coccineum]
MSDSTGGITDLDDMEDIEMIMQQLQYEQEQEAESSHRRNYIYREHEQAEERLMADYFDAHLKYLSYYFRKRCRMSRKLFLEIVAGIENYIQTVDHLPPHFDFFRVRPDATDNIMESVISCETAKDTWTDLVHSFEGPSNTKENRIMDLKLEYQTFRGKPNESLSQPYTRYKTLLNELANDGVNLSKHEINVGFVNSLPEKWSTFSQGLRNANHTQTLDLAYIYGRFVYEDNLIQRRISNKIMMMRWMKDLVRSHFAKDCFSKTSKPSYKSPVTGYSSGSKGFQPKFTPKLIQSSQSLSSQANPKIQKDYKAEYKTMKAKLALLEASSSSSQTLKTFQPKKKCLVDETFD